MNRTLDGNLDTMCLSNGPVSCDTMSQHMHGSYETRTVMYLGPFVASHYRSHTIILASFTPGDEVRPTACWIVLPLKELAINSCTPSRYIEAIVPLDARSQRSASIRFWQNLCVQARGQLVRLPGTP